MADESTAANRALEIANGLLPPAVTAFIERYSVTLLTVALGLGAFAVYHFAGAADTAYNNFVLLADAFLHGHIDIKNGAQLESFIEFAEHDGKYYIIPPPWPAVLLSPLVAVFGPENVNQTFISAILGGVTAGVVFHVARALTDRGATQIWLTVLVVFGTVFWYAAANGGVWFFSHTVAVLFLFIAIYFTIAKPNPLVAGLCLGAAYWTRQPTILTFPFFVIMFSDLWLKRDEAHPWTLAAIRAEGPIAAVRNRVNLQPLVEFGAGLGLFVVLSFIYNYMRFDTPLDRSQHNLPERVLAQPWFNHGPFDVRYIPRHVTVAFEGMPRFQPEAPYVLSTWGGMAVWATTPAWFLAFFNRVRDYRLIAAGIALAVLATSIPIMRAVSGLWGSDWQTYTFPSIDIAWFYEEGIPIPLNTVPFFVLIGAAVWFGRRDKFVLACWAAVIPTALMLFTFAGTGFAQFGYRFSLDYMPFLFLLTAHAIGRDAAWYHKALIVLAVLVNLWGVLWTYHFEPNHVGGLTWTTF
jgi:hypothetical protein